MLYIPRLRAELIGDNECRCAGIVVRSTTPMLALCRKLVAAGINPALPLECYRGETLCLIVASIGEAATLEPNSNGTGFVRWRARVRAASPIAPLAEPYGKGVPAPPVAPLAAGAP